MVVMKRGSVTKRFVVCNARKPEVDEANKRGSRFWLLCRFVPVGWYSIYSNYYSLFRFMTASAVPGVKSGHGRR